MGRNTLSLLVNYSYFYSMSRTYPQFPVVGIGIVVLRADSVLLIRRGKAPALGEWSLPGGAQELGETAEQAARRELAEETGLTVGALLLAAHVDCIHRDEAGRILYHYTILDFAAAWQSGEPRAGSDSVDVAWAPFDALDKFALRKEAQRVIAISRHCIYPAG
jgi:ADP-ribose pyrophosphatase YjhB (NUDIX family)